MLRTRQDRRRGRTEAPAESRPDGAAEDGGWAPGSGDAPSRLDRRVRTAQWVAFFMLCFTSVQILVYAVVALTVPAFIGAADPGWQDAVGIAGAAVLAGVTLWMLVIRVFSGAFPSPWLYWSSCALALAVLWALGLWFWTVMLLSAWWSAAYLCARGKALWSATAVLLVAPWALAGWYASTSDWIAWDEVALVWAVGAVYGPLAMSGNLASVWLYELARDAVAGREAQARLAVSEERLRFARDVHDLLGHSLSGMAVQSDLATRLADRGDPGAAAEQMRDVQSAARTALREMRSAVAGYRAMDLGQELENVGGVLTASGIRVSVEGGPEEIPDEVRGPAAWVVREGATNVVRHSDAGNCSIVLRREEGRAVVEVRDDGAGRAAGAAPGNGITGLTERVASAGGTLEAGPSGGGGFVLRAVLPTSEADGEPGGAAEAAPG
ncbi:sensor histidine kinase [Nocardiopsis suaedae]|uniref:Histidine kinase n=1 Tax=Nocardiopsis suaedae TaxID=3018444 RepID=A0ABT4TNN4_9ACTN|nr:histidine kinase [Nocardiopsis suaedae]MDA2806302.1 histidine kinase [Nocardiopsis suaedae]